MQKLIYSDKKTKTIKTYIYIFTINIYITLLKKYHSLKIFLITIKNWINTTTLRHLLKLVVIKLVKIKFIKIKISYTINRKNNIIYFASYKTQHNAPHKKTRLIPIYKTSDL